MAAEWFLNAAQLLRWLMAAGAADAAPSVRRRGEKEVFKELLLISNNTSEKQF
jgi:hypothetical protein